MESKKEGGIYNLLRARFLLDEESVENWRFIIFMIFLAILMIANTQLYERKVFEIQDLDNEVKELRSVFVDTRSNLMELRMESTISKKMMSRKIYPSEVPPVKIIVRENKEKTFFEKLWK